MAVLAISLPSMGKEHIASFEFSPLILLATVGMLLMVEANDFMTLFMGLEMQGLSLYILAALIAIKSQLRKQPLNILYWELLQPVCTFMDRVLFMVSPGPQIFK